jgi:hypothetical protein
MPMMRPSISSFFRPEAAEYMRTALKAEILDEAGAAILKTGALATRDAEAAERINAVRNMLTSGELT